MLALLLALATGSRLMFFTDAAEAKFDVELTTARGVMRCPEPVQRRHSCVLEDVPAGRAQLRVNGDDEDDLEIGGDRAFKVFPGTSPHELGAYSMIVALPGATALAVGYSAGSNPVKIVGWSLVGLGLVGIVTDLARRPRPRVFPVDASPHASLVPQPGGAALAMRF